MAHDLPTIIARARRALAPPAQKAAPARYDHIDFVPPKGVREALRRGLELHEQGESGDGLQPETVAWARRLAAGEAISPEKARAMAAWFARHRAQGKPDGREPTPKLVSDLLWGGDPGQAWSGKLVEQMDAADHEAEKAAPASLAERARAALVKLRANENAQKEAVTTADLGPGVTPPQVGADERAKFKPGVQEVRPVVVGQIAPAQGAAPEDEPPASGRPPKLVDFGGIPVLVDRPRGFVQRKLDDAGQLLWERTYQADYGYLAGTEGGDHEGLDVFLGSDPATAAAWWAVQTHEDGSFDEYKLLLGFPDEEAARACYVAHIPAERLASLTPMPLERLRALLGLPLLSLDPTTKAALLDAVGEATGLRRQVDLVASTKAATKEEQFIFGIVLTPEKKDLQREIYAPEVVRQTAHDYLAFFRNTDLQHKVFINEAVELVESTVEKVAFWMARDGAAYPADPVTGTALGAPEGAALRLVPRGTWTVAHRVKDPELWAAIKRGDYTGYSINGLKKLAKPPPSS